MIAPIELDGARLVGVRHYLRIAELQDPAERLRELDQLIAAGREPTSSYAEAEISRRTADFFAWPSEPMTTLELMRTYQVTSKEVQELALDMLAKRADPQAHQIMRAVLARIPGTDPAGRPALRAAVEAYFAKVDDRVGREYLAELTRFEDRAKKQRAAVLAVILRSRDDAEAERLAGSLLRQAAELDLELGSARDQLVDRVAERYAELPVLASLLAELGDAGVATWGSSEVRESGPATAIAIRALMHSPKLPRNPRRTNRLLFSRENALRLLDALAEAHHSRVGEYLNEVELVIGDDPAHRQRLEEVKRLKAAFLRKECEKLQKDNRRVVCGD